MLIKKKIKLNNRKNLALYKEHLLRRRTEQKRETLEQIREMQEYWTIGRIVRDLTHASYMPLLMEGLVGAGMAYATRSYTKPDFLRSAFRGISGLFSKTRHKVKVKEEEDDTPHSDL